MLADLLGFLTKVKLYLLTRHVQIALIWSNLANGKELRSRSVDDGVEPGCRSILRTRGRMTHNATGRDVISLWISYNHIVAHLIISLHIHI